MTLRNQGIPILSATIAVVAWSAAFAQPAAVAPAPAAKAAVSTPFLWKIEGGMRNVPAHLFGTIHIGTAEIRRLRPGVEQALNEADVLVTEIPFDAATQLRAVALILRSDGKKLRDSVGPEVMQSLADAVRDINPALGTQPFERMKTWAVAPAVLMIPHQLAGDKALDVILWERAAKAGKKTVALETPESQMKAFEVLSEEQQTVYLRAVLDDLKKSVAQMQGLIDSYTKGDEEALRRITEESIRDLGDDPVVRAIGQKLVASLLTDRDLSMADAIDRLLRTEPGRRHFIAIGAAHLLGPDSVRKHLEAKGWTITRGSD